MTAGDNACNATPCLEVIGAVVSVWPATRSVSVVRTECRWLWWCGAGGSCAHLPSQGSPTAELLVPSGRRGAGVGRKRFALPLLRPRPVFVVCV